MAAQPSVAPVASVLHAIRALRAHGLIAISAWMSVGAAACGSSGGMGPTGSGITIHFLVQKGSGNPVSCASVKEIQKVLVTLIASDGRTVLPGFPMTADCATGTLATSVPQGTYRLSIEASGKLAGGDAPLFSAQSMITPDMKDVEVSLAPEVAYLTIGWTFENQDLMPCLSNDVDHVTAIISSGSTHTTAFNMTFPCSSTPVAIDQPFPLDTFSISIQAYSSVGAPLYSKLEMRTPERGSQEYDLILAPEGNLLYLDWEFGIRAEMTRMCDDPRVQVGNIVAAVKSLEGGGPITETFACTQPRPYKFHSARYRPGRQLEVDLVSDSMVGGQPMRFKAVDRFMMPDGDKLWMPPMVMWAVGTATVSINVATSTCSQIFDGFDVTVSTAAAVGMPSTVVVHKLLQHPINMMAVDDLPYGTYAIDVAQVVNSMPLCRIQQKRTIDSRFNVWNPFVL